MINSLSEFISQSSAVRDGDSWIVYCDGENKVGTINNCKGETEYEAKENAWEYYSALVSEINKDGK